MQRKGSLGAGSMDSYSKKRALVGVEALPALAVLSSPIFSTGAQPLILHTPSWLLSSFLNYDNVSKKFALYECYHC